MARIVLMGTPEFAVPTLLALAERQEVVGVVTQPDRPAGRGREVVAPPVKQKALALGLPVYQPETLRRPEAVAHLAEWRPDAIVVAAFGQILRKEVLELAPHGCLNVHASLLPRWRGAAPVAAAILAGDEVTGVTIMRLDEGMDTGPILAQAEVGIGPEETTGSLTGRLAEVGARLMAETLEGWLAGRVEERPQEEGLATYCKVLRKEDGWLDWRRPAEFLERLVRACDPWPGAYTTWQGQRLKVLRARARPAWSGEGVPGQAVAVEGGWGVVAGKGLLEVAEVQMAGKRAMGAGEFLRGQKGVVGARLQA